VERPAWHFEEGRGDDAEDGHVSGHVVDGAQREGAKMVDQQLGLEVTPDAYIARMVEVFTKVRRVLRPEGTLWLNVGDCYATGAGRVGDCPGGGGLKPKDLVGVPWRLAFALQAAGWWLRADIIWAKPAPMPESVRDRPTKAHEYLFLLAKAESYYYDAAAIAEPATHAGRCVDNTNVDIAGTLRTRPHGLRKWSCGERCVS
jgi:hypothetical protein